MDEDVARLNIEHLQQKLAKETDPAKRETLLRRLEEEEVKLASAKRKRGS